MGVLMILMDILHAGEHFDRGTLSPSVADIRGGNKTNNSSVRLDHFLTSESPASPTLFTKRRRECSSPEHALKPYHIVHVHIYIFKQLVQSSYNRRTPARGSEAGVSVLQLH